MNSGERDVAEDPERGDLHAETGPGDAVWSIRRLIGLIDDAIDSAGAQLARSAGLWADSPLPRNRSDRPALRRRSEGSASSSSLDELNRDHGIGSASGPVSDGNLQQAARGLPSVGFERYIFV